MSRLISPTKNSFNSLRQPLTTGERLVFDFFHKNLATEWEIYIQPHMNGLRPDFVLLNPDVGIAVFEVKDWNLRAMNYEVNSRLGKPPLLIGYKDGRTFSLQKENPIEKVYRYKKELFALYCPRLAQKAGFAAITAGVIFPLEDDARVQKLFAKSLEYRGMDKQSHYNPVSGRNSLLAGDMSSVFPEGLRVRSQVMNSALANDLRYWLREPEFSSDQRKPLTLDENQKALVTTRTKTGYRRIKGSAGSGKSLVLAARAAELVNQGKKVLVVTFNITLLHYLMDISVRWTNAYGNTRENITWMNFHAWCRRICEEADMESEYRALWKGPDDAELVLSERLPALVASVIDGNNDTECYDAVLIDEGQDFRLSWWNVLRKVCKPDGEMLLVADATQDIYDTASAWTDDAMNGAGFRGDWTNLPISYRMPKEALEQAKNFALKFLPTESLNLPENNQSLLSLEPCQLRWVHTNESNAVQVCEDEIFKLFQSNVLQEFAISEVTFLCSHKAFGMEVVTALEAMGINTVNTYEPDEQKSRRQKMAFYMGDARVKATTLHSFKGWESRILVIFVGNATSKKDLALAYTGLTRLKSSVNGSAITIVSTSEILRDFGKSWPVYEEIFNSF